MPVDESQVLRALQQVKFPGFNRDVISLDVVRNVRVSEGVVRFEVVQGTGPLAAAQEVERAARAALESLDGVSKVDGRIVGPSGGATSLPVVGAPAAAPPGPSAARGGALDSELIPGVRNVIAVASGKGGVGKSTVAVNLAVALAAEGLAVGLLDADIYGPSIPIMMGLQGEKPQLDATGRSLLPFEKFGVRFMSLGFLVDPDSAVIWRGPMVMKAIEQLLRDVDWGRLDLLVVDMPPGTGDAQLTLSQRVRLAGSVIVTTPQDVALADAVKGVAMFRKVDVPVLGIVENMSYFQCPACSERTEIFGHGGGREQAARLGVPFLGEIPLDAAVRDSGDRGRPVAADPGTPQALAFGELSRAVCAMLEPEESDDPPKGGIFERFRRLRGDSPAGS